MKCPICEYSGEKLFEDDLAVVFESPQPAAKGHLIIATKEHLPIMELVPDTAMARVGLLVKKFSSRIVEQGAKGCNVLVNNGEPAGQTEPHFSVHVVPRNEGDGIELGWQPGKAEDSQLDEIMNKLADVTEDKVEKKEPVESQGPADDYLMKSIDRIP